jgi:hypothetical protein
VQADWVSAFAAAGGVAVAGVSAIVVYREYRLAALRRLAQRLESERYSDRFWRLAMALRSYGGDVLLYPNPRTATLDAWAVIDADTLPMLVTELRPLGHGEDRVQALVREALGPGYTDELRADFIDFYNLVRRVADWMGLYRALRGDYWEPDRFRDWRQGVGDRIWKRATAKRMHSWDWMLAFALDFTGFRGRRVGWWKRRRAMQVLRILGLEFVGAVRDHRMLVSRLFLCTEERGGGLASVAPEAGRQAEQDYYHAAYGLYDYGYSWLTTVLWESGHGQPEMLDDAFFELRDLEASLAKRRFREFEPWIIYAKPAGFDQAPGLADRNDARPTSAST